MLALSQIRCFIAVAEELHFSRAAERLNMTQPPLSRQIRLLEHQIGTQLIERTSRSVHLTAAGKSFLPEAVRILRMTEEAAVTARRVAKGDRGSLAIGFTAAFGYGVMPKMTQLLREIAPGVSLTLREFVSSAQLEALDSGKLDIGLLRPHPAHGELDTVSLAREALYLAIPQAEAEQWPTEPTIQSLEGKPFLMYSPYEAQYFYQLLNTLFDAAGVKPEIIEYISQIHTMLALVNSGQGVALIPAAASRLNFDGVILRKLITSRAEPVEQVCSFRRDNNNPILALFKERILPQFTG